VIVVPDDFPSVFEGTPAHERAKKLGDVAVFTERGADGEQELIRRIGRAEVAINIRAHARFSEAVFAACPGLKMVSVWGTGTDNVDLNTAGMRGVTVCNTPGVNAFAVAEHALALMLAVARKITTLDAEMRKARSAPAWRRSARPSAWTCWAGRRSARRPASGPPGPRPPPRRRSWPGRMSSACTCA
jgi:D-3-phosphoglycerate dehydrogenase